jgi:DNA-binding Xre family transcriptional regulator
MDEANWTKAVVERWEAQNRALAKVDESGCWAPPGWVDWTLHETLIRRRRFAGLSQREVSRRSGVDQAEVSRVERGRDPRWSTLDRLAFALDCELVLRLKPNDPSKGPRF